jgi:hypothetical protein
VCPKPFAGPRGASSESAASAPSQLGDAHASPYPEEHYHDKRVWLPTDKDAELVLLRRIINEGESRGWKLVSAVKQPGAGVLWVTWDTSGSSSG